MEVLHRMYQEQQEFIRQSSEAYQRQTQEINELRAFFVKARDARERDFPECFTFDPSRLTGRGAPPRGAPADSSGGIPLRLSLAGDPGDRAGATS
jgi:hypothetical protein